MMTKCLCQDTTNLLLFFFLFPILISCGQNIQSNKSNTAKDGRASSGLLNVVNFGAKGDGKADDTKAIQAVINQAGPGDTVFIPAGTFIVRTLKLRSNVHIKSDGILKQLKPEKEEEYTLQRQNSGMPLFRAHRVNDISLSFRAETVNEAIYTSTCSNISVNNSYIQGDSSKLRAFPGILMYQCRNCTVQGNEISYYGKPRTSAKDYRPGTGIRILASNTVAIRDNHIHHNGENGIFIHATENVTIDRNRIRHNGMSAVQIAFGSTALEKDFIITNNTFEHNAADAIDINNRTSPQAVPIRCLIAGNYSADNGFVNGKPTPDGSGIATLIHISGVEIRNNRSVKSNRPALYLENCGDMNIHENQTDGVIEIVHQFDEINLKNNTFGTLLLLANTKGKKLYLDNNIIDRIALPSGISTDSLLLENNLIKSGPLNINLTGHIILRGNELRSQSDAGAILIVNATSTLIQKNKIISTKNFAISTRKSTGSVRIDSNRVESANACIFDDGSKGLQVTNNLFISIKGGNLNRTLMSTNPVNLFLRQNEHRAGKGDNAIRLLGKGTAQIINEKFTSGYPDYGDVRVETQESGIKNQDKN